MCFRCALQEYRGSQDFAFIGCYIVEPEYRGLIYGALMGKRVMASLADCNIGIDGVLAQQEHYRHFGFELVHRNLRYAGDCKRWPKPLSTAAVVDAKNLSFAQLQQYDRLHFPAHRTTFLQSWLNEVGHQSLAYLDGNRIMGYGTVRKCVSGYKVGPLFASDRQVAECLLLSLADWVRQAELYSETADACNIYLDISEENAAAQDLANKLDMQFVFETARMYSAGKPDIAWHEVYGITTFELG